MKSSVELCLGKPNKFLQFGEETWILDLGNFFSIQGADSLLCTSSLFSK